MMKISASYWIFEGGLDGTLPIQEAIEKAAQLGFDAIELGIASQGVLTHQTTQSECEAICAEAKKYGLEISGVASGESWGSSPTSSDVKVRETILDFTQKALQITQWLGTDAYLFVPGAVDVFFLPDAEVVPYDICYERATAAISQLLPIAEKLGVTIAIENVWNKFLLSPLEMRDFIDKFKSVRVGAYFEVGNVMLTGYPDQWIRILGSRIKRVHIKDFKLAIGTADGFVDLQDGDVDFEAIKIALAEINYDGYVTAEMIPYVPGRPEKTAAAMKNIFK
jgi:L-ribulose-5-phosphate 3-epimerase